MFRKFWKTIKFFLIAAVVLIVMPRSILPHQSDSIDEGLFGEYSRLNREEKRLSEYRDNDEALKLKIAQLELINNSRKKNNAGPVKLDILASRVANKISREAAENDFMGHFNLKGEKPYHRYAMAGGRDHITENAYAGWTTGSYSVSSPAVASLMKEAHISFMSERAPADGHKVNIIEKSHNYVGIGYSLTEKQFRYYEEYIDRYIEFDKFPTEVKSGEEFRIGITVPDNLFLYYIIAYREDFPSPMTAEEINSIGSYEDYTDEKAADIYPWDLARMRNGRSYSIPLKFNEKGLYYVQIYVDSREIRNPSSMNTMGKNQVSGIVIRVD